MKIIFIISAVVVVLVLLGFFIMMQRPDLSHYEILKTPRISDLPQQKVLEVRFDVTSDGLKKVFGVLYKTYFKLKGVPKQPGKMPPSAARYENAIDFEMDASEREKAFSHAVWKGVAAIPLPDTTRSLPEMNHPTLKPHITTWQYGPTAEILHVGPYQLEPPTVAKLKAFIDQHGYEIAGMHEEVYLRGPGSFFTKPKDYVTIIRYPVKPKTIQ